MDASYIAWEWTTGGKCSECGKPFEGMHLVSKITCGPACRKRRERRQKSQLEAYLIALGQLQKMRAGIKRGESLEVFREQLNYLKGEINDLLVLAKDEDAMARQAMLEERARRNA